MTDYGLMVSLHSHSRRPLWEQEPNTTQMVRSTGTFHGVRGVPQYFTFFGTAGSSVIP
jgi:hypothetical protein